MRRDALQQLVQLLTLLHRFAGRIPFDLRSLRIRHFRPRRPTRFQVPAVLGRPV
jgi:hypothetical protein